MFTLPVFAVTAKLAFGECVMLGVEGAVYCLVHAGWKLLIVQIPENHTRKWHQNCTTKLDSFHGLRFFVAYDQWITAIRFEYFNCGSIFQTALHRSWAISFEKNIGFCRSWHVANNMCIWRKVRVLERFLSSCCRNEYSRRITLLEYLQIAANLNTVWFQRFAVRLRFHGWPSHISVLLSHCKAGIITLRITYRRSDCIVAFEIFEYSINHSPEERLTRQNSTKSIYYMDFMMKLSTEEKL